MNFNQIQPTDKWMDVWKAFLTIQPRKEIFEQNPVDHFTSHFDINGEWSTLRNFFFERLRAHTIFLGTKQKACII